MLGLMQDRPLLISGLLDYAERYHGHVEIVSRTCEGTVERCTWRGVAQRARQIAQALQRLGVKPGDRVATLAWNTHRHLELYFAVSGMGAVLHTVNPRLFPEQIAYILDHGGCEVLLFDITFADLVNGLRPRLPAVRRLVAMTDAAHMPASVEGALCYETLLAAEDGAYAWPQFDERTASSLCYTSGTTGNPKGVLYTHRSTVLHTFGLCHVDTLSISCRDSILVIVPLFHVNAWGSPYAAAMSGAKLVLPGPAPDPRTLFDFAVKEQCTFSLGVPTVWLGFFKFIDETPGLDLSGLKLNRVAIGGSAAPRAVIERFHQLGVFVLHAWGMSETSPLATVGTLQPRHAGLTVAQQVDVQVKQGHAIYGVELRIVDDKGTVLPHDGSVAGDLQVRGPWVTSGYFRAEGGSVVDSDGWFSTGDVAKIDADGFLQLTDRSKDVIKSGGEWISSIDLENAAMAHPGVQEAAVIGVHHPRWQERPLLIIVPKPGAEPRPQEILDTIAGQVAKWWLPDDVVFVQDLPHTATGKLQKVKLREQFKGHVLPDAS